MSLKLLDLLKNPASVTEADNDFWHTKEKRLDPEFHELTLELLFLLMRR